MKKLSLIALAMIMALSFTSCKKEADVSSSTSKGSITSGGYFKSDQPAKLTTSWMEAGNTVNTNLPVLAKATELTNFSLENVLSNSTTDQNQAISLMMASGKLPDILHTNGKTNFFRYARDGAIIELDDLIDKYAPNIKKFLEENPKVKKSIINSSGKIYFIPGIPDGDVSFAWMIRQDWLDKLGLQTPTTTEEYYKVLKAFKERDPNGNGKADEIPYFNRNAGVNFDKSITSLYVLWNAYNDFIERDGTINYGPLEPQFKEAVTNIAKWYKEGLIDNEIFTRGNKAREVLLGQDIGGSTYDWIGTTLQFNESLTDKVPGLKMVTAPPPSGRVYDNRGTIKDMGWAISSTSKNPIDAIRYMDFWFSDEGRVLANYGIEGETYTMVDGKPMLKDDIVKGSKAVVAALNEYGAQLSMGYKQDFEYEKQWLSPLALEGMEMYVNGGYIKTPLPTFAKTPEQEKRFSEVMAPIKTYLSEIQQQWILGAKDIDSTYDEFVNTLKQMKIEEAIKINQDAYDASLNLN